MNNECPKFNDDELRRAIKALATIERQGDPDQFELILCEARNAAPSADPWQNAPIGARSEADHMARRLAALLGAPLDDCREAAAAVYARDRGHAVYDALMDYAAELTERRSGTQVEPICSATKPQVRIVAGKREATPCRIYK